VTIFYAIPEFQWVVVLAVSTIDPWNWRHFSARLKVPGENLLKGNISLLQDDVRKLIEFLCLRW